MGDINDFFDRYLLPNIRYRSLVEPNQKQFLGDFSPTGFCGSGENSSVSVVFVLH